MSLETPATAQHFATAEQQRRAVQLGMWLFLVSEVLLFTGLFVGYGVYRLNFPEAFAAASRHLDVTMGTVNTLVLVTSSFTVALGVHSARTSSSRRAGVMFGASVLLALAFLVIKAFEYRHHLETGALPGRYYALEELPRRGSSLFFTLYFFMTGLHAIHVLAGVLVLGWIGLRALRGEFSAAYFSPVELSGMYWHLVDLVWIFLYPLLYLV